VLASILTACGIDAAVLERAQTDPAPKQALIDATDRALAAGVCGAPSFLVRTHLFWGQDRLDFVRAALEGWTPE
jgi:2-hydroxychromene-2-carboxylate isomerase